MEVCRLLQDIAEGNPWMKISSHCRYDGDTRTSFLRCRDSSPEVYVGPQAVVGQGEPEETDHILMFDLVFRAPPLAFDVWWAPRRRM